MSRWNSQAALDDALGRAEASVTDAAQIRTARGTEACPINAQGWAKIDQGKITIEQILDDPVTNARYLKNDTAFTGSSAGAGTMFNPDGATTSAADHFRVILRIDGGGRYRVVTASLSHE